MQNEREPLAGRLEGYEKSCGSQPAAGNSLPDLKTLTSAAAGLGLLLACPHAEAAIVYNGAQNISLSNTTYLLDMDSDSVPEFRLFALAGSYYSIGSFYVNFGYAGILPVTSNVSWLGSSFVPERLSNVYNVGPAASWESWYGALASMWTSSTISGASSSYSYGNFRGERGFIGVRFEISGETKYGWIDFEGTVGSAGQGTIHGWAYEACTDEPIMAGATTGGADCDAIPTLNEWGMIILVGLLAAGGLVYGRKEEELVN